MDQILVVNIAVLWLVVLFNSFFIISVARKQSVSSPSVPPASDLKLGQQAPNFEAETINGERVCLADYVGKAVALLFVGMKCPNCREAIPSYERLIPFAKQAGVELLLVSEEDMNETRTFIEQIGIRDLQVVSAPRMQTMLLHDYKVHGTPSFCLVDLRGKVKAVDYADLHDTGSWQALTRSWGFREVG